MQDKSFVLSMPARRNTPDISVTAQSQKLAQNPENGNRIEKCNDSTYQSRGGGGTHEDEDDESMEYEQNPDCRNRVANESSNENDGENLMKDFITVECNKLNGKLFNGSVNFSEAKTKIFQDGLGLDANLLSTVQIKFIKYPIITFKLKSKINVALVIRNKNFEFTRKYSCTNIIQ